MQFLEKFLVNFRWLLTEIRDISLTAEKFHYFLFPWQVITRTTATPVAGPRLRNSLPAELHQPDNELREFKQLLKMLLFAWDYDLCFWAPYKYCATTTTRTTTITTRHLNL